MQCASNVLIWILCVLKQNIWDFEWLRGVSKWNKKIHLIQKQRVCKTTGPNSSAQLWQVHFYVKAHVNNNSLIPCDTSLIRLAHIHGQWTCDESFYSKIFQIIDRFGQMVQISSFWLYVSSIWMLLTAWKHTDTLIEKNFYTNFRGLHDFSNK